MGHHSTGRIRTRVLTHEGNTEKWRSSSMVMEAHP
jgi:hypothetical protein